MAKKKRDFDSPSFLKNCAWQEQKSSAVARVYVLAGPRENSEKLSQIGSLEGQQWQQDKIERMVKPQLHFEGTRGPVWIVNLGTTEPSRDPNLAESEYAQGRDLVGSVFNQMLGYGFDTVNVEIGFLTSRQLLGCLVGIDMTAYQYKMSSRKLKLGIYPSEGLEDFDESIVEKAMALAGAVNLSRHLVNLPPNYLNPVSYSELLKDLFSGYPGLTLQIWNEKKLAQEGCHLHLGVGQGSATPPRFVHLRYRPKKSLKMKPLAFVGKGITFDSGGLDIKPSSGMRLMKKDMGGSACIVGLCSYVIRQKLPVPCDFYLALAENSVGGNSFRPSDILTARSGLQVEIHNTDAEGRLVLADAMDVAVTQKGANEPQLVIDVATLTGAIKVALGADIAGLFSNDPEVSQQLQEAGVSAGDLNWPLRCF